MIFDELGRYIREYVGWMDHFDTALPRRVHRVYYERFVTDPEGELRRLLDYCGLPFERECLRFYTNPRIVPTNQLGAGPAADLYRKRRPVALL